MTYKFDSRPLTRYLSFSRFIAMLELGLFVPKASLFEDPFEGVLQFASIATVPESVSQSDLLALKEWMYVSCWYDDHHESHAMWNIYGNSHESVAIQTTTYQLIKANWSFPERPHTYFDKVRYLRPTEVKDFDGASITVLVNKDKPIGFTPIYAAHSLFMKHKGYEYENEMRLVVVDPEASVNTNNPALGKYLAPGDSRELIQNIFIHPLAPQWFEDATRLIVERYKLEVRVTRSSLSHSQLTPTERK
jgi:Protein of unknown function (DUF2971)